MYFTEFLDIKNGSIIDFTASSPRSIFLILFKISPLAVFAMSLIGCDIAVTSKRDIHGISSYMIKLISFGTEIFKSLRVFIVSLANVFVTAIIAVGLNKFIFLEIRLFVLA